MFLIVDHESERFALPISEDADRNRFEAWRLVAGEQNWFGLALGAVEVEVDVENMVNSNGRFLQPGDVFATPDGLFLKAFTNGRRSSLTQFRVGDVLAGTSQSAGIVFGSWRLVQRDHLGAPIELFGTTTDLTA